MGTQEGWETDSPEIPSPKAADAQTVRTQHLVLVPALFLDTVFHFQVPCCPGLLMLTVHLPNPLLEYLPPQLPARTHSMAHLWVRAAPAPDSVPILDSPSRLCSSCIPLAFSPAPWSFSAWPCPFLTPHTLCDYKNAQNPTWTSVLSNVFIHWANLYL